MTTVTGFILPSVTTASTNSPSFLATLSDALGTAYEVRIYSQAQYNAAGFDPASSTVTYYSGIVAIQGGGNAFLQGQTFYDLTNGTTYRIYLRVATGSPSSYSWSTWGAAGSFRTFTIAVPPPVPAITSPVNGTFVNTSRPFLDATVDGPMGGEIPYRRHWQFANDFGFTQNVLDVVESDYSTIPLGPVTFPALPVRLKQGNWLARCRCEDQWGVVGAWGTTIAFSLTHAPAASSMSPGTGGTVPWISGGSVTFGWQFTDIDTDDFQTKYKLEYWQTSNQAGTTISTGEIANVIQQGNPNFNHVLTLPSTSWRDVQIGWRVMVADQDGIWSPWSDVQTFYVRDAPVVAITNPTNASTVGSPLPVFSWTFTATGGRTQAQRAVSLVDLSTGATILQTGYAASSATTYTPGTSVVTIGPTYQVRVDVIDSSGLSAMAVSNFTAFFTPPTAATFTVDGINMSTNGGVTINWTGSVPNAGIQAWRVYRRSVGGTTWKLVRELGASTFGWVDYTCPSNTAVQYSVVQVALDATFGVSVESSYVTVNFTGACDEYILVVPDDTTLNMKLDIVTGDSLSDEYEMGTLNLLGRGRRVETGTRFGVTGKLSAQLYDDSSLTARAKKRGIDLIRDSGLRAYLRNPFGDVWSIAVMSAGYDRIAGVGTREYTTVSIDYSEIEDA